MADWILEILKCPKSGGRLVWAPQDLVQRLEAMAQQGQLYNVMGRTVSTFSSQGLVSENGDWVYQVDDGILCMLWEEAIDLRKLGLGNLGRM